MSNRLISGYLERVSSKVFDEYHKEITSLIGNQRGVYALYKKHRLYYVGLATNLRTRVKHHLRDRHAKKWDGFSLYLIHNADHLQELESLLIRIAEPRGNMKLGGFRGSLNLRSVLKTLLRRKHSEKEREMLSGRKEAESKPVRKKRTRNVKRPGMRGAPPLAGILAGGAKLTASYKGGTFTAEVDGQEMILIDGKTYNSPSLAATHVTKRPMNGWVFWKYQRSDGTWSLIDELRKSRAHS